MARLSTKFLLLQCLAAMMMITSVQGEEKAPFEIIIESVECHSTEYAEMKQCRVHSFNSTFRVAGGSGTLLKDVPEDSKVEITAFEMMPSGRYSMVPVKFPAGNICSSMAEEKFFWKDLTDSGNLPKTCPIKVGEYYANNFYLRSEKLPQKLPGTRWRLDLVIKHEKTLVWKASAHIFIDRK